MQLPEVKPKHRNNSLFGLQNSMPSEIRQSTKGRDSATKIRINESIQVKQKRKLYRPSTATRKKQSLQIPSQPQTSRILKYNQNIPRRILSSGKHIQNYMQTNKLSQSQTLEILQDPIIQIQVQMFMSVNNLIEGSSETYKQIQSFLIDKLKTKRNFIKQVMTCQKIENKIENLISMRMKKLNIM